MLSIIASKQHNPTVLYIWYAASKQLTPSVQPADDPSSIQASFTRRKHKPGHTSPFYSHEFCPKPNSQRSPKNCVHRDSMAMTNIWTKTVQHLRRQLNLEGKRFLNTKREGCIMKGHSYILLIQKLPPPCALKWRFVFGSSPHAHVAVTLLGRSTHPRQKRQSPCLAPR